MHRKNDACNDPISTDGDDPTGFGHLDVDLFLRTHTFPDGFDIFEFQDGRPMTPSRALAFLTMEKARGHRVIPLDPICDTPCGRAAQGCKGFDRSGGGCGFFGPFDSGDLGDSGDSDASSPPIDMGLNPNIQRGSVPLEAGKKGF